MNDSSLTNVQEHLVEVPFVAGLRATPLEPSSVLTAELLTPAPNDLIAQLDPALEQHFLNLSKRHPKVVVKPEAVTDDLSREVVAFVEVALHKPLP